MANAIVDDGMAGASESYTFDLEAVDRNQLLKINMIGVAAIEDVGTNANVKYDPLPFFSSSRHDPGSSGARYEVLNEHAVRKRGLAVVVPPVQRRWEYLVYEEPGVRQMLGEYNDGSYPVQLDDGYEEVVTLDELYEVPNGARIFARTNGSSPSDSAPDHPSKRASLSRTRPSKVKKYLNISSLVSSSDDELVSAKFAKPVRRGRQSQRHSKTSDMRLHLRMPSRSHPSNTSSSSESVDRDADRSNDEQRPTRRSLRQRGSRRSTAKKVNYSERIGLPIGDDDISEDDVSHLGKRKRDSTGRSSRIHGRKSRGDSQTLNVSSDEYEEEEGVRRSGRNVKRKSMREIGEDYIPEKPSTSNGVVKYTGARESFRTLADDDDFRLRHCQTCETCGEPDDSNINGFLVFCQGCTLAYHQKCLGPRNAREHLVTKVGEKDFVLQCKRCIGLSSKKDSLLPDQGVCSSCGSPGEGTAPFRDRKSTKEEQKEREDNGGEDPVTIVLDGWVNNEHNILFRCLSCYRSCHMYHLPPKKDSIRSEDMSEEQLGAKRFSEYHTSWLCKDCSDAPAAVESLVAWRPIDVNTYEPGTPSHTYPEASKEYLVKWKKMSYHSAQWMPGPWVWGVTAPAMRKAFGKRDNEYHLPKMTTAEAVPEDFLRIDIILAVEYTNVVKLQDEKIAKARITEVKQVYVKFKGLGYEDVVWQKPPSQQNTEEWADFKSSYDDWVTGLYIHEPPQKELRNRLGKVRNEDFGSSLEMKTQPTSLTRGKMMDYQLEGLNWIYYQWYKHQNAILADEMGLGKTIQVIGFLAALRELHGCWPFLLVVPNSTCPNWRREIKQWAPSLRVVSYYGSAEARRLSARYELFPEGNKKLGCHVVVTSYDAAQDSEFRQVFRGVHWAGLVVDEGQRLKNDKNILYGALNALKPPFKLLLTGTPLQNNARELFNLLQFIDSSNKALEMEETYATLTKENVAELHEKLRQCFLRRTKAEVLKFLPSMAQIILPVSMTIVQKKLYKFILAKNPELIRSIFSSEKTTVRTKERTSLNNILMQLRKCLCHPFVYSRDVEVQSFNSVKSHRGLVEASNKLGLLEVMLPKLQERGHRVLIFSQFLDMLDVVEDFLDGLGLSYERLDGNVSSLQKQKRIDAYNAPGSPLFAFLLSTRAGGVGINLATADTVIILDPDFNPHQDIQALSRAHRIGQQKKVLVFQLTTRATAEEKIMQIGKQKMALDQVLIEQMDAEDADGKDIETVLRYGAEALFKDDESQDIKYDSASVDKLLDRSQVETTQPGKDKSAESQFSYAKVWVNDKATFEDGMGNISDEGHEADPSIWEAILKEREQEAAEKAAAKAEILGRGRRSRQVIDYSIHADDVPDPSPGGRKGARGKRSRFTDSDDTAFEEDTQDEEVSGEEEGDHNSMEELEAPTKQRRSSVLLDSQGSPATPMETKGRTFKRAEVPQPTPSMQDFNGDTSNVKFCVACDKLHVQGQCPLKLAGVEYCNLCGLPHFGYSRTCPHLNSVTQLRLMLEALKNSPEPQGIKDQAKKVVTGIIGDLNQRKRRKAKEIAAHEARMRAIKEDAPLDIAYAAPPYGTNNVAPPNWGNGVAFQPPFPGLPNGTNGVTYSNHGQGLHNPTVAPQFYHPFATR